MQDSSWKGILSVKTSMIVMPNDHTSVCLEAFEKGRYVSIEIGISTFYHSDIMNTTYIVWKIRGGNAGFHYR